MVDALDNEDISTLAEDQRRQKARNLVTIQANCTCSALTLAQRREEIAAVKHLSEAMNMLRKGQIEGVGKGDIQGQVRFVADLFKVAA